MGTGRDRNRPLESPVLLSFLTSLIAGFGEARHTMRQQQAVKVKSVSFILKRESKRFLCHGNLQKNRYFGKICV